MKTRLHHWVFSLITLTIAIAFGLILIPFLRSYPETLHNFILGLHDWQRIGFVFLLCVLYAYTMFKLFSPRLIHLKHALTHPPTWFAWALGVMIVGIVDVKYGLNPNGYKANAAEWIGYAGGAFVLIALYRQLLGPRLNKTTSDNHERLEDITNESWEVIEDWLSSDAPAEYDFLGNRTVAKRLASLLVKGTRSIGIVGPFGAGKTSILQWMMASFKNRNKNSQRVFVTDHSCWGFEDSASSIHEMLADAIGAVESAIDTFHVSSLPESYRQTFSAGGEWINTISNVVLGKRDPADQFEALSELLGDLKARLVIIVEDLDRNNSKSFDIQEVLAFLQQLKDYDNISFVLTGGLSSRQIDFAKLCDHIEYLRTLDVQCASTIISRLYRRCTDRTVFPHYPLGSADQEHEWNPNAGWLMRDYEELSLPQATALLLNTPRSLRLALGRTYSTWQDLYGEVDLNHLIGLNALRFGAPECFQFIIRRWDRLHSPPSQSPAFGKERVDEIREAILSDWKTTASNVEWNSAAALKVMKLLLPASEYWLVDNSQSGRTPDIQQGLQYERYWLRAVNEAIGGDGIRDQRVIADLREWLESPSIVAPLISGLVSSETYSNIWEDITYQLFFITTSNGRLEVNSDQILLVCEHVMQSLLRKHGACATHESQGFIAVWRFANKRLERRPQNCSWLQDRISEAASIGIEFVNALWHFFGSSRQNAVLRREDTETVRKHLLYTMQQNVKDGESLSERLCSNYSGTLYELVFDPGNETTKILTDLNSWRWLGPPLLESLRAKNVTAASNAAFLISGPDFSREAISVEFESLRTLFGDNALEAIQLLDEMTSQVLERDRRFVGRVIASARIAIEKQNGGAED